MFSRQHLALVRAGWGTAVSLAAVLVFASAGLAQEKTQAANSGKNASNKASTPKTKTEQKNAPEIEKARAEVKTLHEQMDKLREQMHATAEKMHKAYANLAKLEGRHGTWTGERRAWASHGWEHWASLRHEMMARGPHGWWTGFHHPASFRHDGERGAVEQRLDHMQREIDQLRRQLSTQTKTDR